MKKAVVISSVAAAALLAALPASATDIMARVISSTPVVQQVAVPRQVCNNQQYITEAPRSGGGALLGALVLMQAQPSVIKRPVVDWGDGEVTVGFDPQIWETRA